MIRMGDGQYQERGKWCFLEASCQFGLALHAVIYDSPGVVEALTGLHAHENVAGVESHTITQARHKAARYGGNVGARRVDIVAQ